MQAVEPGSGRQGLVLILESSIGCAREAGQKNIQPAGKIHSKIRTTAIANPAAGGKIAVNSGSHPAEWPNSGLHEVCEAPVAALLPCFMPGRIPLVLGDFDIQPANGFVER
jgi:hypothetical protein